MVERRHVISGGLAAAMVGLAARGATGAVADDAGDAATAAAIANLQAMFERQFDGCELGPCSHIDRIRQVQRAHLAAREKYPDFIEVGIDLWDHVYDWHVKHRQPIDARRLADGRYAMTFMFTTLVLRPDQPPDYMSSPFDLDGRP